MPALPPETKESWNKALYGRLEAAMQVLQGKVTMQQKHRTRCYSFKTALRSNPSFREEVRKLSPLEFELSSISFTNTQLDRGMQFFNAKDISGFLSFGIDAEHRRTVQDCLLKHAVYQEIKEAWSLNQLEENIRLNDLFNRIQHTICKQSARELYNKLGDYIGENPQQRETAMQADLLLGAPSCLAHLEDDSRMLLCIIHAAGGIVPDCFFKAAWTYDRSGNPTLVDVPVPEVLRGDQRSDAAINDLLERKLLLTYDVNGTLALHPEAAWQLSREAFIDGSIWQAAVLDGVCRAFPRWWIPLTDHSRCKALMPSLTAVLPYLLRHELDSQRRHAAVEVCLSASYFGLLPWKELMLHLAKRHHVVYSDLMQRLALREKMLDSLQCKPDKSRQVKFPNLTSIGPRVSALFGERDLEEMRVLVNGDAPLVEIEYHYKRVEHLSRSRSTEEKDVWFRARALYARALKNTGRFAQALITLEDLWYSEDAAVAKRRITAIYADTLCEKGNPQQAMNILSVEINSNIAGTGSRMQLALANAYLAKALFTFLGTRRVDVHSLLEAESLYGRYMANTSQKIASGLTKTIKYRHHIACAGIAMVQHTLSFNSGLDNPAPEAVQKVISAWQETIAAAKACWPIPGFAHMIAVASLSEVTRRFGMANAMQFKTTAKGIGDRLERQYHFTLQGTVWLDVIEDVTGERFTKHGGIDNLTSRAGD